MGSKSNYLELRLLDHVMGAGTITTPATLYFALYSTIPSDTGGGVELSAAGYARLAITNNTTNFPAATTSSSGLTIGKGEKALAVAGTFAANSGGSNWPNIVGWGMLDASTGGNLLLWGECIPVAVTPAASFVIPAGTVLWRED